MIVDQNLAHEVLTVLLSAGGDFADVYVEDSASVMLQAEGDDMERVSSTRERGAGLRLVTDGVTHFASTVDLSSESLLDLAGYLASGASSGEPVRISDLTLQQAGPLKAIEDSSSVTLESKGDLVLKALRAARSFDKRIVQAKSVYRDTLSKVVIATSGGSFVEDLRSYGIFLVHAVASDGENMQVGYEPRGGIGGFEQFRKMDPEEIAIIASGRAITTLESPEAPAGRMTVVLSSEAGGTMVHEAVGHGLEADLTGQELSVYSGRIGEVVASSLITIVDDPTIPGRRGSYNFDDEGTSAEKTVLVQDGVLKAYMNDLVSSRRDGVKPTGNGRRQSFRHWPIPRMSNTIILPGKDDPEKIIASVDEGLLVRKMGGGQVNTVSGDFVFEVSEGHLIENGEIGTPVRGATLAGNGPEVLNSIDMVGSDLGFAIGTCGKDGQGVPVGDAQPTMRLLDITVGGRGSGGQPS